METRASLKLIQQMVNSPPALYKCARFRHTRQDTLAQNRIKALTFGKSHSIYNSVNNSIKIKTLLDDYCMILDELFVSSVIAFYLKHPIYAWRLVWFINETTIDLIYLNNAGKLTPGEICTVERLHTDLERVMSIISARYAMHECIGIYIQEYFNARVNHHLPTRFPLDICK